MCGQPAYNKSKITLKNKKKQVVSFHYFFNSFERFSPNSKSTIVKFHNN